MKGYKTVAFNLLMGGVMLMATLGLFDAGAVPDAVEINAFIDKMEAFGVAVWTVGNWIIRKYTTTAIFNK